MNMTVEELTNLLDMLIQGTGLCVPKEHDGEWSIEYAYDEYDFCVPDEAVGLAQKLRSYMVENELGVYL